MVLFREHAPEDPHRPRLLLPQVPLLPPPLHLRGALGLENRVWEAHAVLVLIAEEYSDLKHVLQIPRRHRAGEAVALDLEGHAGEEYRAVTHIYAQAHLCNVTTSRRPLPPQLLPPLILQLQPHLPRTLSQERCLWIRIEMG